MSVICVIAHMSKETYMQMVLAFKYKIYRSSKGIKINILEETENTSSNILKFLNTSCKYWFSNFQFLHLLTHKLLITIIVSESLFKRLFTIDLIKIE